MLGPYSSIFRFLLLLPENTQQLEVGKYVAQRVFTLVCTLDSFSRGLCVVSAQGRYTMISSHGLLDSTGMTILPRGRAKKCQVRVPE